MSKTTWENRFTDEPTGSTATAEIEAVATATDVFRGSSASDSSANHSRIAHILYRRRGEELRLM